MEIGDRIRGLRKKRGLSQTELADSLGVTQSMIGQYERGIRKPKLDTLERIAKALNTTTDYLWYGLSEQEMDEMREYELVVDTLKDAGFSIKQTGFMDYFAVSHIDGDSEDGEEAEEIEYSRLSDIVHRVLKDAENNKSAYIQKRLEAELFWPKGWRPT